MPSIIPVNWKRFEKVLLYAGCRFVRQKGDHRVYWRTDLKRPIILPTYKSLPVFVIRNNLRTLGLGHEEYLNILSKV